MKALKKDKKELVPESDIDEIAGSPLTVGARLVFALHRGENTRCPAQFDSGAAGTQ